MSAARSKLRQRLMAERVEMEKIALEQNKASYAETIRSLQERCDQLQHDNAALRAHVEALEAERAKAIAFAQTQMGLQMQASGGLPPQQPLAVARSGGGAAAGLPSPSLHALRASAGGAAALARASADLASPASGMLRAASTPHMGSAAAPAAAPAAGAATPTGLAGAARWSSLRGLAGAGLAPDGHMLSPGGGGGGGGALGHAAALGGTADLHQALPHQPPYHGMDLDGALPHVAAGAGPGAAHGAAAAAPPGSLAGFSTSQLMPALGAPGGHGQAAPGTGGHHGAYGHPGPDGGGMTLAPLTSGAGMSVAVPPPPPLSPGGHHLLQALESPSLLAHMGGGGGGNFKGLGAAGGAGGGADGAHGNSMAQLTQLMMRTPSHSEPGALGGGGASGGNWGSGSAGGLHEADADNLMGEGGAGSQAADAQQVRCAESCGGRASHRVRGTRLGSSAGH